MYPNVSVPIEKPMKFGVADRTGPVHFPIPHEEGEDV